ncbi:MAG: hypothetical protein DKM50_06810 [Candidatus Margulisiibacteriota bacterium]|nr:MAG: hypothetical protein DKM50_06810 [Candidatus Margulisiibacteriota bacterium]HCY35675.1 hypothetical protein [Candidatus Margulisiibacteriota bacterium]
MSINLSVIIPTRNRAGSLSGVLDSICVQSLSQGCFEVIVVDNGSSDNTKQITENFIGKIKNLKYFYEATPGLHVGRHIGLKEAQADILVYTDDDIIAFPNWLAGVKESFQNQSADLVGGKILPRFETAPPSWIMDMWNKRSDQGQALGYLSLLDFGDEIKEISPHYVWGCNFAIRKSILLDAGGFHPDGMPQELIRYRGDGETFVSQHVMEKGYKTLYNPKASVYHIVPVSRLTIEYFMRRSFNQAISDAFTCVRKSGEYGGFQSLKKNIAKARNEVEEKIIIAYNSGIDFYTKEINDDQSLLEWIMEPSYL